MKLTESQLRQIIKKVVKEEAEMISPRDKEWNSILGWVDLQIRKGASEDDVKDSFDRLLNTVFAGIKKRRTLSAE